MYIILFLLFSSFNENSFKCVFLNWLHLHGKTKMIKNSRSWKCPSASHWQLSIRSCCVYPSRIDTKKFLLFHQRIESVSMRKDTISSHFYKILFRLVRICAVYTECPIFTESFLKSNSSIKSLSIRFPFLFYENF